jgi:alpha-L-fucosidase
LIAAQRDDLLRIAGGRRLEPDFQGRDAKVTSIKLMLRASAACAALAVCQPAAAEVPGYQAKVEAKLREVKAEAAKGPFKPDWDNLRAQYRTPEWFRDAKFGIFIHWGVYSVPAFANEWYSRNMYVPGNAAYEHHVKTYGPQSKFGYKDFIPQFRAEKFDPPRGVDLFADARAPDVIPVAQPCDRVSI